MKNKQVWRRAQRLELNSWRKERRESEKARWVEFLKKNPHLKGHETVLDVGSGPDGIIFYANGKRNVAVDPLMFSYLGFMPRRKGVHLVASIGENLPFKSNSFETVFCMNALDHTVSPESVLGEIRRVLKPGGTAVMHVYCYTAVDKFFFRFGYKDPNFFHHPHKMLPADVICFVGKSGMKMKRVEINNSRPPIRHFIRRRENLLLTLLRTSSYILYPLSKKMFGTSVVIEAIKLSP